MKVKTLILVLFTASLAWSQVPTKIKVYDYGGGRSATTPQEKVLAKLFKGFIDIESHQGVPDIMRHATKKDTVAMVIFYEITTVRKGGDYFVFDMLAGIYRKGEKNSTLLPQTKWTFQIDLEDRLEITQTLLYMYKQVEEFVDTYKLYE